MSLEFTFIAVPYMLHLKFVVTDGSNLILPLNTFFYLFFLKKFFKAFRSSSQFKV